MFTFMKTDDYQDHLMQYFYINCSPNKNLKLKK